MQDSTHIIRDQVRQAAVDRQPLFIRGGNSKRFYGRVVEGEPLDTTIHRGITAFEPTELVLTARAGTPLVDIEAALQEQGQILACEPPHFSEKATLGGMVATGLSGPGRPYRASVQDAVLGCTLINGRGEILRFGGKVMKNVAGYDVSRMMAGSMGCLGVLLDVTLKVIPAPKAQTTIAFTIDRRNSMAFINELRRQGLPVTASCQVGDEALQVRFSAGHDEISALTSLLETRYGFVPWQENKDPDFWEQVREQRLAFFSGEETLWRLSLPADANLDGLGLPGNALVTEWGGALHWVKAGHEREDLFDFAASANGHAAIFRTRARQKPAQVFQPLGEPLLTWHRRLKQAFDPDAVLNPGRMHAEF